ncbi:uncharacterized protein DUF1905 [Stackebrandtia albiflava]|uniref:Uncharacterized protein DUF1905 n=1 Tax=Stackebrandtia albiflava TaxID=406432 RepID=A0A562URI2_9ACTN|nr:YdeI/OmpD-associated family protein [Stackebrandtia albiflava]TWJ08208.1 uncharacterized protein DUF1905 [Stackebrandtia albiflava]
MQFTAMLREAGDGGTVIDVPEAIVDVLNSGDSPPVRVTLRDYTWHTSVTPGDGGYLIPVSEGVRGQAGVGPGEELDVLIDLDAEPEVVEMPEDFTLALDAEPDARERFESLPETDRSRYLQHVIGAETDAVRRDRIAETVAALRDGDTG